MDEIMRVGVTAIKNAQEKLSGTEMASLALVVALASMNGAEDAEVEAAIDALIPQVAGDAGDKVKKRQAAKTIAGLILRE